LLVLMPKNQVASPLFDIYYEFSEIMIHDQSHAWGYAAYHEHNMRALHPSTVLHLLSGKYVIEPSELMNLNGFFLSL
jgi:hypothetical protein